MIVGVVTTQEPLCLVTQFHGINGTSSTLHHVTILNVITSPECLDIFVEIYSALKHVHSKGFLHNDIKANNVFLERRAESNRYTPILIDLRLLFSKTRIIKVLLRRQLQLQKWRDAEIACAQKHFEFKLPVALLPVDLTV